jgi:GNAT superfamily N-acetyltransferase
LDTFEYNEVVMAPALFSSPNDHSEALAFFEGLLRADSECRLVNEYPLVFLPDSRERLLLKKEGNRIVAGLAMLERNVEVAFGRHHRLLFVGSVVTAEDARMKGYQRELFDGVEAYGRECGADAIVLWSSQISFYEKLGFFLGGLQATWIPSHQRPLSSSSVEVKISVDGHVGWRDDYFEWHSRRRCVVQRSLHEMRLLWGIPRMVRATTDQAYVLLGKGEDFQDVVHEWAGDSEHVLACLDALRAQRPGLRILSPGVVHSERESEVVGRFERENFECRLEYLGLFKPISSLFSVDRLNPHHLEFPFFIWGLDSI